MLQFPFEKLNINGIIIGIGTGVVMFLSAAVWQNNERVAVLLNQFQNMQISIHELNVTIHSEIERVRNIDNQQHAYDARIHSTLPQMEAWFYKHAH